MISVYLLLDYQPFKTFVFTYRLYPFLLIFTFSKSSFFTFSKSSFFTFLFFPHLPSCLLAFFTFLLFYL